MDNYIEKIIKQQNNFTKNLSIIIDDEQIQNFEKLYFKAYPKRKKKPIDKPYPPNLNKFILWQRPQQNNTKQLWKMFVEYLTRDYRNLKIDNCVIHFHFIFPDRRHRDIDNYLSTSAKLIIDGLTQSNGSGVLVDDSYQCVQCVSSTAEYIKGQSKTIINIRF